MEWKNIIGGVSLLIIGVSFGRSSPINNQLDAKNNVNIVQEIPKIFENNSKNYKSFENNSNNLEKIQKFSKININTASKYDLMELAGIGTKKAEDIINGRPYEHPLQLLERDILGYYSYENNKDIFIVGD